MQKKTKQHNTQLIKKGKEVVHEDTIKGLFGFQSTKSPNDKINIIILIILNAKKYTKSYNMTQCVALQIYTSFRIRI